MNVIRWMLKIIYFEYLAKQNYSVSIQIFQLNYKDKTLC